MARNQRRQFIKYSTGTLLSFISLPVSIHRAIAALNASASEDDEFLWLEKEGRATTEWVTQQNQRTVAHFAQSEDFRQLEQRLRDSLNDKDQIPWVSKYGDYCYNIWQDETNLSGLLRRTTLQEYRKAAPAWETVYEARPEDIGVFAFRDNTPEFERDYVGRILDFYRQECFCLTKQGKKIKIGIPADASFSTYGEWLLIKLNSDWTVKQTRYLSGSLLATHFDDFLAGKRKLQALFVPDQQTALSGYSNTRDHLILNILENVANRLEVLTPHNNQWKRQPFDSPALLSTLSITGIDNETNNYFLTVEGFLQPSSLYMGNIDDGKEAGWRRI